jgi:hypothetical protein
MATIGGAAKKQILIPFLLTGRVVLRAPRADLAGVRSDPPGTDIRGIGSSGMTKSGGEKMQAAGQKRAAADERRKGAGAAAEDRDTARLMRETERLRAELANEKERVKTLEDTNIEVAERLDAAIESMKEILARQG